jgi:hypothetical protein
LLDGTRFQSQEEIDTLDMHMSLFFTRLHKLSNIYTLDCPLENRASIVMEKIKNL